MTNWKAIIQEEMKHHNETFEDVILQIFDYNRKEDFGVEQHIFTLLKGKRRSFLQVSFDWNEYPSGFCFQIGIGNNRVIDILFWCWKFGAEVELLGRNWNSWND